MPSFLGYLRIAFSVTCGIACVLLIVLWVRSYTRCDNIYCRLLGSPKVGAVSHYGCLSFGYEHTARDNTRPTTWIEADSVDLEAEPRIAKQLKAAIAPSKFGVASFPGGRRLDMPSYFAVLLVLMAATIAARPWITGRFSLRTLLVAMTLIAVVLGLVVWSIG
jgi:hypothetical protein